MARKYASVRLRRAFFVGGFSTGPRVGRCTTFAAQTFAAIERLVSIQFVWFIRGGKFGGNMGANCMRDAVIRSDTVVSQSALVFRGFSEVGPRGGKTEKS
jgi:hypothetical protein